MIITMSDIATDWSKFDPSEYLQEYYLDVGGENFALLQFFVKVFREIPKTNSLLEFGGGPTIYSLITASTKVEEIYFCDYLNANLEEVRKWLAQDPYAFDWRKIIKTAMELEANVSITKKDIILREKMIRSKVKKLCHCDAKSIQPLCGDVEAFDILISNFCVDSITNNFVEWQQYLSNIVKLIKPGGRIVLSTLKSANFYTVGEEKFPAVNLSEVDIENTLLDLGFSKSSLIIESVPNDHPFRTYRGLIMSTATKK